MKLKTKLAILFLVISLIPAIFIERLNINIISIIGVVFVFLVTVVAFSTAKSISDPMERLMEMTKKISEGNLDQKIENINSKDEIGQLASSFNKMIEKLKISYTAFEDQRQDLLEAKAKDEALLASIGDGLVATDKKGRIVLVNKVFENMLGWKENEVKGSLLVKIIPMFDENRKAIPESERPINLIIKNYTTTTTTTTTSYYKRKDGTFFPIVITTSPIISKSKFIGVVEIFRDITKERSIDKAKTEFVSFASHQLRTPLTTVSWYTEMILSGDMGKVALGQKKYLQEIYQGNQRMIELVNTLLNISRIELGTMKVEPKPTDIVALAQSIFHEQKLKIKNKKLIIVENFSKDMPTFLIDPNLLRMIFQNLLSNAVEYTQPGGQIEFSISFDDKKNIQIKVSDNGYGIPKNQIGQIFDKLFRADNIKEKDTTGTGLGLYIVKLIVDNLGGKINVESEENKGSTFYISLPQ